MLRISPNIINIAENAKAKQPRLEAIGGEPGHFSSKSTTGASPQPLARNAGHTVGGVESHGKGGNSGETRETTNRGILGDLLAEHRRLIQAANDVEASLKDIRKYGEEGARNAQIAAVWAATLMTADIIRHGLSATYRSAERQFAAQDKAVEKANKFLKKFGIKPAATRKDVLDHLDDEAANKITECTRDIQQAREMLRTIFKAKPPRWAEQLLNTGIAMAEDTALLLQAQSLEKQEYRRTISIEGLSRQHLERIKRHMQKVEEELGRLVDEAEKRSRTA